MSQVCYLALPRIPVLTDCVPSLRPVQAQQAAADRADDAGGGAGEGPGPGCPVLTQDSPGILKFPFSACTISNYSLVLKLFAATGGEFEQLGTFGDMAK